MKKLFLLLLSSILFNNAFAQENYSDRQTFYIDDSLTLECWITETGFTLCNTHDVLDNGLKPDEMDQDTYSKIIRTNLKFKSNVEILKALREVFTMEELSAMKGMYIDIDLVFDKKGDIVILELLMDRNEKMMSIPPQKYGQLYKNLKSRVKFHVTDTSVVYNGIFTFRIFWDKVRAGQMVFAKSEYL